MTPAEHREEALRLDDAKRARKQIRMISLRHPEMTIADAYAVQNAWRAVEATSGRTVVGHKIGLTSKAMQAAVGIKEPDSGYLTDDMLFSDGGVVPAENFIGLRIEAELAFVLNAPLSGAGLTIDDVLDATDHVAPALEILDTRIFRLDPETGKSRTVRDTISDNAANAGVVLGGRKIAPRSADLAWIGAVCAKNGEIEETGLAAGVLGHPATGVAWLAARMAANGEALLPGQIVLAGSFIRPIEVGRGDAIVADYGPHGEVRITFK
jgi:2-oxo-hept-3-ene-1,7-dioate hydratase